MLRDWKDIKGMLVRSSRGGKGVISAYISTAEKYNFTGVCVVRNEEFVGLIMIRKGCVIGSLASIRNEKIGGRKALERIEEVAEKESSIIELWARIDIEEIIKSEPSALLEIPVVEKYEKLGFSTDELKKRIASSDKPEKVIEEFEKLIVKANELLKKLSVIKEEKYKDRIKEIREMLKNPYNVDRAELLVNEIIVQHEEDLKMQCREKHEYNVYDLIAKYDIGKRCPICGELLSETESCDFCGYGKIGSVIKTMTFKNFVLGQSTMAAYNAAIAVANRPGSLNPLVIQSSAGLGKTHLLNAIGNAIQDKYPNLKITYISAENINTAILRELWESDVILIDDFQFVPSDRDIQLVLHKLFEKKFKDGKQIVIALDRSPREILNLSEKLQSFLDSGITVVIDRPEFETRMMIAKKFADEMNVSLDNEVLEFIAKKFKQNAREIEGGIKKIIAFAKLINQPPTIELAKEIIKTPSDEHEITLSPGKSYLIEEEKPALSLELLESLEGKKLCISRQNPKKILENYDLVDSKLLWLTTKGGDMPSVPPSLEHIMYEIENFIRENEYSKGAIYLDGVEYLISENGFDSFIQFIRSLVDIVSSTQLVLIISLSPETVEKRHLRIVEREMDEIISQ